MIIKKLSNLETRGGLQYNRVARITAADISAAATTKTVKLVTGLAARGLIKNFAHDLITTFDGGATSELTIKVGHNGATVDDDDAYIAATSLHEDASKVICAVGAGANNVGGYMPVESTDIEAVFTATGANTSVLTQGEVELRWLEASITELRALNS